MLMLRHIEPDNSQPTIYRPNCALVEKLGTIIIDVIVSAVHCSLLSSIYRHHA